MIHTNGLRLYHAQQQTFSQPRRAVKQLNQPTRLVRQRRIRGARA